MVSMVLGYCPGFFPVGSRHCAYCLFHDLGKMICHKAIGSFDIFDLGVARGLPSGSSALLRTSHFRAVFQCYFPYSENS